LKSQISGNLLQSIRVRREIDLSIDEREKIYCIVDRDGYWRVFRWPAMTFAHAFQKYRFIVAVMDQLRVRDSRKSVEKIIPYPPFFVCIVCPETVLDCSVGALEANPDQVVEIAVRKALNI
jgi:hypothetical protein